MSEATLWDTIYLRTKTYNHQSDAIARQWADFVVAQIHSGYSFVVDCSNYNACPTCGVVALDEIPIEEWDCLCCPNCGTFWDNSEYGYE